MFLILDDDRAVLHKRPPKGLLAGLFEPPNAEGHLGVTEATAYLRSIGFEPLRMERVEDSKHIFTHIEWNMMAYLVRISPDFDGVDEGLGYFLMKRETLAREYAVPSAFSSYERYLKDKHEKT